MTSDFPDFFAPATLERHIAHTMGFYYPRCIDPSGGFYHFFKDDGTVYDASTRHLVSSTRFVFTFSMAYRHFKDPAYLEGARVSLQCRPLPAERPLPSPPQAVGPRPARLFAFADWSCFDPALISSTTRTSVPARRPPVPA